MKIPKIIDIMKFFTNSLVLVQPRDNPALRVIIPTTVGCFTPWAGEKLWAPQVRVDRSAAP